MSNDCDIFKTSIRKNVIIDYGQRIADLESELKASLMDQARQADKIVGLEAENEKLQVALATCRIERNKYCMERGKAMEENAQFALKICEYDAKWEHIFDEVHVLRRVVAAAVWAMEIYDLLHYTLTEINDLPYEQYCDACDEMDASLALANDELKQAIEGAK
jgi:hypothetical protein